MGSTKLSKERKYLRKVFNFSRYSSRFVNQMSKAIVTIPFVTDISEEIRKTCCRHETKVAFRASRTLHSLLTKAKDPLPVEKQSMVVYQILCSCGQVCIGKAIRRLETRLKEHKDASSRHQIEKPIVAEEAWEQDNSINSSGTLILDHAIGDRRPLLKELNLAYLHSSKGQPPQ